MNELRSVAVIMDGNGRWAKKRGLPRTAGHTAGAKNVRKFCTAAKEFGIEYVTLYAFSTENWSRPKAEVDALMKLLAEYLDSCEKDCKKNNMRIKIIGDKTALPLFLQEKIKETEEKSKIYNGFTLNIAVNYGSRNEIVRAVKNISERIKNGSLSGDEINEEYISSVLDTCDTPDPELLIRTGGEKRLSNYLLWQLAYTEFYFSDVAWPDFDKDCLKEAIDYYYKRDRRFGGIKEA